MPPKVMITWADEPGTEEKHGRIMAMPAYVGGEFDVAGLKWIPSVPDNPARNGLPRANALVLLTDPRDRPAARGDGRDGGLGDADGRRHRRRLRHLADPDAEVACLLGAGVLAHTQLEALRAVLPRLREVRVYDPAAERCRRFCARAARPTGLDVRPAASAEEAVRGAGGRRAGDDGGRAQLRRGVDRPGRDRGARLEPGRARSTCTAVTDLLVVDDWEHESTHAGRYAAAAGRGRARSRRRIAGACELADVVAGRHPGRTDAGAADRGDAGRPGDGRRRRRLATCSQGARSRGLGTAACGCGPARRCGSERASGSLCPRPPTPIRCGRCRRLRKSGSSRWSWARSARSARGWWLPDWIPPAAGVEAHRQDTLYLWLLAVERDHLRGRGRVPRATRCGRSARGPATCPTGRRSTATPGSRSSGR